MRAVAGKLIGARYRVDAQLGRRGLADVYRAWDLESNRPVAVKVLRAGAADRRRFETETEVLRLLEHHNVVPLLDAGHRGGIPYLVFELVEGPTLGQRLTVGQLDSAGVHSMGRDIARALAHVHARGIVHRDVKPPNILLAPDGRALLADVGVARLLEGDTRPTGAATTTGTVAYLAPEQIGGREVTGAADVYALGLVLIEALSGHQVFTGTSQEILATRLADAPPIPDGLEPPWPGLLHAMTRPNPAARPGAATVAARLGERPVAGPAAATATADPMATDADPAATTAEFRAWAAVHAPQPHLDDISRTPAFRRSELGRTLWLLAATFAALAGLLTWMIGFR